MDQKNRGAKQWFDRSLALRLMVMALVAVLTFSLGHAIAQSRQLAAEMIQQSLLEAKGPTETRKTLDPSLFSRMPVVNEAYTVAREIPEVLDKLFCYCYCEINPNFRHKSLLTCYTDEHAVRCGICLKEALVAKQMTKEGKTPQEIAIAFKKYYLDADSHEGHNH